MGTAPVSADKEGMKPTAVQYPSSLSLVISEFGRVSARLGGAAYAISLLIAGVTLVGSCFYQEITHTFGRYILGMRAGTLWEAGLVLCIVVWLTSTVFGFICVAQKGRTRRLGLSSLGINLAAALLVVCTLY